MRIGRFETVQIGLRLLAFMVDAAVALALTVGLGFALMTGVMLLRGAMREPPLVVELLVMIGVVAALPVAVLAGPMLCFAVPTALWGRTPGRWVCRLRVIAAPDAGDRMRIGPSQARRAASRRLAREMLKLAGYAIGLGAIVAAVQIGMEQRAWYDRLCGTTVALMRWRAND